MGPVKTWVVTDPDVARTMLVTRRVVVDAPAGGRRADAGRRRREPVHAVGQGVGAASALGRAGVPASKALESRLADLDALIDDEVDAIPLDTTVDLELAMGRIALVLAAWVLLGEELDADARRGDRASSTRGRRLGRRAARPADRLPPGRARASGRER